MVTGFLYNPSRTMHPIRIQLQPKQQPKEVQTDIGRQDSD